MENCPEKNCYEDKCTCKNTKCERHGKCCECIAYHRDERGNLPSCLKDVAEKLYAAKNE